MVVLCGAPYVCMYVLCCLSARQWCMTEVRHDCWFRGVGGGNARVRGGRWGRWEDALF